MRKDMLKYCVILLTAFLFCAKVTAQTFELCDSEGTFESFVSAPSCQTGCWWVDPNGFGPGDPCITTDRGPNSQGPYLPDVPVPLGDGVLVSILFLLGYGFVSYSRHRKKSELV